MFHEMIRDIPAEMCRFTGIALASVNASLLGQICYSVNARDFLSFDKMLVHLKLQTC